VDDANGQQRDRHVAPLLAMTVIDVFWGFSTLPKRRGTIADKNNPAIMDRRVGKLLGFT